MADLSSNGCFSTFCLGRRESMLGCKSGCVIPGGLAVETLSMPCTFACWKGVLGMLASFSVVDDCFVGIR